MGLNGLKCLNPKMMRTMIFFLGFLSCPSQMPRRQRRNLVRDLGRLRGACCGFRNFSRRGRKGKKTPQTHKTFCFLSRRCHGAPRQAMCCGGCKGRSQDFWSLLSGDPFTRLGLRASSLDSKGPSHLKAPISRSGLGSRGGIVHRKWEPFGLQVAV